MPTMREVVVGTAKTVAMAWRICRQPFELTDERSDGRSQSPAEPPPKPLTSRLTCGHQATMSRPQIVFSVGTGRSKVSNSVHIPLRSGTADCAQIV